MLIIKQDFLLLIILSFTLFSFTVKAEPELKVITLQHRFADDLLPSILPMVGANGMATGMQNQLIIRVSPNRMPDVLLLVKQLDVARVNRRITINRNSNQITQLRRTEVNGNVSIGNVTISNDRQTRTNTANIELNHQFNQQNSSSSQFLNVLDGERAFIRVGKSVPFTQEWIQLTRRYVQINHITDWRDISTGFAVKPRAIGNQIELEITPRIANPNNQGVIDFEEHSTVLRISLGQWVDIGGTMQKNDDVSRQILGNQNSSLSQKSSLKIRVD